MDIPGLIQSAPLIDIIIFLSLFAAFIVGMSQGALRRVIGIFSTLVAFLLAANLRDPIGSFLADNWIQFTRGENYLLAFAILFCVFLVAASILAQGFYKRTDIYAAQPIVDELVGGVLGVVQGVLLLVVAVVIFSSYAIPGDAQNYPDEIKYLKQAQDLFIHESTIAGDVRDHLVPTFIDATSILLPGDLVARFP